VSADEVRRLRLLQLEKLGQNDTKPSQPQQPQVVPKTAKTAASPTRATAPAPASAIKSDESTKTQVSPTPKATPKKTADPKPETPAQAAAAAAAARVPAPAAAAPLVPPVDIPPAKTTPEKPTPSKTTPTKATTPKAVVSDSVAATALVRGLFPQFNETMGSVNQQDEGFSHVIDGLTRALQAGRATQQLRRLVEHFVVTAKKRMDIRFNSNNSQDSRILMAMGKAFAREAAVLINSPDEAEDAEEEDLFFDAPAAADKHGRTEFLGLLATGALPVKFLEDLTAIEAAGAGGGAGAAPGARCFATLLSEALAELRGASMDPLASSKGGIAADGSTAVSRGISGGQQLLALPAASPVLCDLLWAEVTNALRARESGKRMSGWEFEGAALLAPLLCATTLTPLQLRPSARVDPSMGVFASVAGFPDFQSPGSRKALQDTIRGVSGTVDSFRSAAAGALRRAFSCREKRAAAFAWVGQAAALGAGAARVPAKELLLHPESAGPVPGRGFMLGLTAVMLQFCTRHQLSGAALLKKLDVRYLQRLGRAERRRRLRELRALSSNGGQSKGGDEDAEDEDEGEPKLTRGVAEADDDEPKVIEGFEISGATDIFFLTSRLVHVGLMPLVHVYNEFERAAQTMPPFFRSTHTAVRFGWQTAIFDEGICTTATAFSVMQLEWLQALATDLPAAEAVEAFACIPDYTIKDATQWIVQMAQYRPEALSQATTSRAVAVCVVLMQRADLIRSPLVLNALVDVVAYFVLSDVRRAEQHISAGVGAGGGGDDHDDEDGGQDTGDDHSAVYTALAMVSEPPPHCRCCRRRRRRNHTPPH
jgi:hypothetical protein